jgi:hypothetical protein
MDNGRRLESHYSGAQDRRREIRGDSGAAPTRRALVSMIVGTYREMPGLSLHLHQAARFFAVTANTCRAVLDDLVKTGELQKTKDGQYRIR